MMRRARALLPLLACLPALAAAACGGEPTPPAPAPAHQSPTPTATAPPTATPTVVATATAAATPTATVTATPEPTPTATPTATPTPEPHGIAFTPITRGEPRPLSAGIALYYWIGICTGCDFGGRYDVRRIVFDEAAGTLREERPLAFFDSMVNGDDGVHIMDFDVSVSGQEMAATVCHAGDCVGAYQSPSTDAEQHLWVSRDAGRTWEDLGPVLPDSSIVEVTGEDVRLVAFNHWSSREHWKHLTDEEWDALLKRLAPLGLDELDGRESRYRWAISGERYSPPTNPRPPKLPWASWAQAGSRPDGAVAWRGEAQDDHLLAIADAEGVVEAVYGAAEPLGGFFVTDSLLVRPLEILGRGNTLLSKAEVIDLATHSIHEVDGLSLPMDHDPEADGQQEVYYSFHAARPAPARVEAARPAIEYTPLTMGEPRELPAGTALYYPVYQKCGGAEDILRVVVDGDSGALLVERPWAFFDEQTGYARLFGVGPRGESLAALVCERGNCDIAYGSPSDDALLALWFSGDGGKTWERWGEVPVYSYLLSAVTEDDVALRAFVIGDGQEEGSRTRAWWFRSGQELELPEGLDFAYVALWQQTGDRLTPIWSDHRNMFFVTASGERLPTPPGGDVTISDWPWRLTTSLSDGSLLWSRVSWNRDVRDRDLFVLADEQGAILRAYSWDIPDPLELIDNVGGELYVGFLGSSACGEVRSLALIDLEAGSVHNVSGPDDLPRMGSFLFAARPAPH